MTRGRLQVVGVGPGDPELMTVRAVRLVQAAKVVAYFCRHDRPGHARTIVRAHIAPDAEELRLEYPFTTEISVGNPAYHGGMGQFYDECAHKLAQRLDKGQDVVLLCEGDPFLYGSAMYLFDRLKAGFETEVVPGIMAMNGCWTQAHLPITHGDDVLCVLPATLPEEKLTNWLEQADAAVIMKTGRNMPQVRRALEKAGRLEDAVYVERGTQENTRMCALQEQEDSVPYFSLVLLPGRKGVR